ncbi:C6 transcription factor [Apiospora aurea]|uniref:C6 transcription factor n=1 Tax=Apiospora aurea TaxID=335848 RepID=A0ABR1QVV1_9PEZI
MSRIPKSIQSCLKHLRQRAMESRELPDASPDKRPLAMFGFEPAPMYVFGTDIRMVPTTSAAGTSGKLTPDLGGDGTTTTSPFCAPVDAYAWKQQSDEVQKKWRLEKATLEPETIRSPVKRSWSTYCGPGHAMVLAVLDLAKPPFEKTSEDQLAGALCRALHQALAPDPQMQRQLRLKVDRDRGAWIQPASKSVGSPPSHSSPSKPPVPASLIGDTAVDIDEDNLATLYMSLNVQGPVTGPDPHLNPWARLASVPSIVAHRRRACKAQSFSPSMAFLSNLPRELCLQVFSHLKFHDKVRLSATRKEYRAHFAPDIFATVRFTNDDAVATSALTAVKAYGLHTTRVEFTGHAGPKDELTTPALPPAALELLEGCHTPNLHAFQIQFNFDFDGTDENWDDHPDASMGTSIYVFEAIEDEDYVRAKEHQWKWRALMNETWRALSLNARVKALTVKGFLPKWTSAFRTEAFRQFLAHLDSAVLGIWGLDNCAGWKTNTVEGYVNFLSQSLDHVFFRHMPNLKHLEIHASDQDPLGLQGVHHIPLALKPEDLPALQSLKLANCYVGPELVSFIRGHAQVLTTLDINACVSGGDGKSMAHNSIYWAQFFDQVYNIKPAIKELVVGSARVPLTEQEELGHSYGDGEDETEEAQEIRQTLQAEPWRKLFSYGYMDIHRIPCDGNKPACTSCQLSGAVAATRCAEEYGPGGGGLSSCATVTNATHPASGGAAAAAATAAGRRSGAAEKRRDHRSLVKRSSFTDTVPDRDGNATATTTTTTHDGPMTMDPVPSQYRETQLILDGINYCTHAPALSIPTLPPSFSRSGPLAASRGLESYASKANGWFMRLWLRSQRTASDPETGQGASNLVSVLSEEPYYVRSSALVRRNRDLYNFKIQALQEVNEWLGQPEKQTSDSTLMCVICLLLSTMQQSAYTDWRAHLDGARRIIQMRGGLKAIITANPYFKPLLALFVAIDVMAATTTPSTHPQAANATSMALHHWEADPAVFQFNLAISCPCPEELFQALILINYLRYTTVRQELQAKRQRGTCMVLSKLKAFSAPAWASRMRKFRGWKSSGNGVDFDDDGRARRKSPASGTESDPDDEMEDEDEESPSEVPKADLWLNVAIIYQSAILLYALRTLIIDVQQQKRQDAEEGKENGKGGSVTEEPESAEDLSYLDREFPGIDVAALRLETRQALIDTLTPIFADVTWASNVAKLIFFPMFVCGMETGPQEHELQAFVAGGLERVGRTYGTLGPIAAAEELREKWAADAAAPGAGRLRGMGGFSGGRSLFLGFEMGVMAMGMWMVAGGLALVDCLC